MKNLEIKNPKILLVATFASIFSTLFFSFASKAEQFFSNTGIGIRGESMFNQISFFQTVYFGECPGKTKVKTKTGWFKEENTKPKQNRRVRIYNQTLSELTNKVPYTDRDYNNSGGTERIDFRLGNEHSNRYFIVKEGLNDFKYVIYDGSFKDNNIVSKGTFSAVVTLETDRRQRDINWYETPDFYCLNPVTGDKRPTRGSSCVHLLEESYSLMVRPIGSCNGERVYGKPTRIKEDPNKVIRQRVDDQQPNRPIYIYTGD